MTAAAHRINRLRFDVQAENPERAFSIRRQLNDDWESLADELERNFDTLAEGESWLRIPRLHLRIRVEHTREIEQRLPALLREAIEAQWPELRQVVDARQRETTPPADADAAPAPVSARADGRTSWPRESDGRGIDRIGTEQVLEYYLFYGRLPWYASEVTDWRQRFEAALGRDLASPLAQVLSDGHAAPLLRLLHLIDDVSLAARLEHWLQRIPTEPHTQRLLQVVVQAGSGIFDSRHQRGWIVARLLATAFAQVREAAAPFRPAWRIPSPYRLRSAAWQELLRRAEIESAPLPDLADLVRVDARGAGEEPVSAVLAESAAPVDEAASAAADEMAALPDEQADAAAPVANAGLVLLHPYLPRFFSACGIDLAAPRPARSTYDRAAAALYYLAAGDAEPVEYELGLVKILLGLDPDYPLPLGAGLLDDETRVEAQNMLDSFIGHWTALKSTSRDGLREAFLRRPGLLRETDEAWLLDIESGGVDILLERLPFSISIVNLPWMQKPIQVEW